MKILFADDSMTAQNMGRKILTEAGYDVVAVSNGAAAVKKIAEQKPDIIILDVYMPGYSGLEVCEKVRASTDTLRTPVLLTVGKMEPYRAEDANRVRADGVIIKPFEASDLLAIVKKLEERIVPKTVALAEQTVLLERPPEFAPPAPQPVEAHPESATSAPQAVVDVPDHMATAAAFSDLLGMDPSRSVQPLPEPGYTPPPQAEVITLPVEAPESEPEALAVPEFSLSATDQQPVAEPAAPIMEASVPVIEEVKLAPPGYAIEDTQPIPVYEEPEPAAIAPSETVAPLPAEAAQTGPPREELQPAPAAVIEIPSSEPVISAVEVPLDQPPAGKLVEVEQFAVAADSEITYIEAVAVSESYIEILSPKASAETAPQEISAAIESIPEDDFEARVAAAMSIYDTVEEKTELEPVIAQQPAHESLNGEAPLVAEPVPFPMEAPASFEYTPPVSQPEPEKALPAYVESPHEAVAVSPAPELEPQAVTPAPEPEPQTEPAPVAVELPAEEISPAAAQMIATQIESEVPAAAAAVASAAGGETQVIARVVHRVMERMMPELIEEISRELKSRK